MRVYKFSSNSRISNWLYLKMVYKWTWNKYTPSIKNYLTYWIINFNQATQGENPNKTQFSFLVW